VDRAEELRYLVLAAQRQGSRRLTEALRPLGATPAQAEVVTVLRESDRPLSVRELGGLLVCESGSPSRLARSVVAAGWAELVPDNADGRVTRLRLTSAGVQVAHEIAAVEATFHRALADALPDAAQVDRVIELLRAVVADDPAGIALARRRGRA
jgi:DNA-binding MarR family transcriptional regulator